MQAHPEAVDLKALPEALRVLFERQQTDNDELRAHNELLADTNRRLEHLVTELRRVIYDKRSEKRPFNDRQLGFEDLEGAVAEVEEAVTAAGGASASPGRKCRAPRRNLGHLPKDLERIEQVIEPDSAQCPCGCGQMIRIGEDRTERLDIVLAQVLISKYVDHLPLNRQSQTYSRSGVELDRSTLAGWVGKASFHLIPVVDRLAWHLKRSDHLFMDETRAPVLDPGRGKTKTGYLWALARDQRAWAGPDPSGVVFFYAPGRGGCHAEGFLEGFQGTLHVDGYAGYNVVGEPGKEVLRSYCWAHARRKLCEIHDSHRSTIAAERLRRIAAMYAIEKEIRGEPAEVRLAERQARTAPLVKDFGLWLRKQRTRISPKSRLGEKLAYIGNHWDGLQVFLTDGRVEMNANIVENAIRPLDLNRKNALFAGHDEGAKAWARIASLVVTAKMNSVNPHAYLKATLEAIAAGHPASDVDTLMPWAFTPVSS